MKTLLITLEFPTSPHSAGLRGTRLPFYGGVANYYGHLVKYYPEELSVLSDSERLIKPWPIKWLAAIVILFLTVIKKKIKYVLVGQILPLGTATWLVSYLLPIKYAVWLHGYDLNCALAVPRKVWLTKKILGRAHKIICANSYTAEQVKVIIDQKQLGKIKIVNPGLAGRPAYDETVLKKLRDLYNLGNKIVLFSLGRLVRRKGFDQVIKALPLIVKETPSLVYYLAGSGPDQDYFQDQVKTLPTELRSRIQFLGSLNEAEKWHWLDLCDIFIMTPRDLAGDIEGFGIVYLEAALAGKPVVASQSGGVADAVLDNQTGLVVDGENLTAISQAISKLASYQGLRQRLGDNARQRVIKDFHWSKLAKKVYNIVNELK